MRNLRSFFNILMLASACALSCNESTTSSTPTDSLCGTMPLGDSAYHVRIVEIVPNPEGTDDFKENWVVKNFDKQSPLNLSGFYFRDKDGTTWFSDSLSNSAIIAPCGILRFTSNKTAQLLNAGDSLFFVNPLGKVIQGVAYKNAMDGDTIKF